MTLSAKSLTIGDPPQKKQRQLNTMLSEIEQLLAKGYTQRQIHAELERQGIATSMSYFKTMLARARKKQPLTGTAAPVAPVPVLSGPTGRPGQGDPAPVPGPKPAGTQGPAAFEYDPTKDVQF